MAYRHLGARFAPLPHEVPLVDRIQRGPWPTPLPAWWWAWAAWVDRKRPAGQRPVTAPKHIPAWAWARYALHRAAAPPVTPPPPPPTTSPPAMRKWGRYLRPIFAAEEPLSALLAPPSMPVFLTADPAYAQYATQSAVDQLRQGGQRAVGAWCNPVEVSVAHLREFAARLGIPDNLLCGQAETAPEFDTSRAGGLDMVVGNLSALRPDQHGLIRDLTIGFMQEDYWNVQPWLVPDWMNLPVLCSVAGLYTGEGPYGRYQPLPDYIHAGRYTRGRDGLYHAHGPVAANHPEDLALAA